MMEVMEQRQSFVSYVLVFLFLEILDGFVLLF